MSFLSEDEEANIKYNKIWKKINKIYGFELDIQAVNDKKYIKTKLKTYSDKATTAFSNSEIPKEKTHNSCIAALCVDSVLKLGEQNYPQMYLEQCKYRLEKKKSACTDVELEESGDEESEF